MRFYVIGDKETITGFSLIGVEGVEVHSKTEAIKALKEALHCKDIGIVLITERCARDIHDTIDNLLFARKKCHVILQIPDMEGSLHEKESVEASVLSALGVRV